MKLQLRAVFRAAFVTALITVAAVGVFSLQGISAQKSTPSIQSHNEGPGLVIPQPTPTEFKSESRAFRSSGEPIYLPFLVFGKTNIVPLGEFLETFDGDPESPKPFLSENWNVAVHTRNMDSVYSLVPMDADHGLNCEPPPASHPIDAYEGANYQCKNHVMTAIDDGNFAAITLTPNQIVDFSQKEAVITFDVSTLRRSSRDWIAIWITPFEFNLHHPLQVFYPDLQGPPKEAVAVQMQGADVFLPTVVHNFDDITDIYDIQGGNWWTPYSDFLEPSAKRRDTFELRISKNHLKFGMPDYNFYWIDMDLDPPLEWDQGIIQFVHDSYTAGKACDYDGTCGPNTWHWDNVFIKPAIPFLMIPADRRYVDAGENVAILSKTAPANSFLRFSGIGNALEVSFDQGKTWQAPQRQLQESNIEDHFSSYWMPVPVGTRQVHFQGSPWYGGDWHVRDISVWVSPGN